ncbi:MAG TPA: hypothetical protein VHL30_03610 [Chlamydiales bacterium]|jgi:hypothetical protein|nr:hypothetical protein [Chlamydiales bacterium]
MKYVFATLLFALSLFGADYDCVFIGSSPISLFEALYQHGVGKKVLIVDESPVCGGSWKSIDICGVAHVDVGCHEIGNNQVLREFLESYGGCQMICADMNNHFYFEKGSYELIRNLEERIRRTNIDVCLNTRADRAVLDENNQCVMLQMGDKSVSTEKVYLCSYSYLNRGVDPDRKIQKSSFFHLYLLIADPTPPRFSYEGNGVPNTSRMMNLTRFVGLENTGQQLIVFQTHEKNLNDEEKFLDELKNRNLVDPSAYILKSEPYVYEQWPVHTCNPENDKPYFETLPTQDFRSMVQFFTRWKQALKPYAEAR